MRKLTMLRGLPAAGKSQWADKIVREAHGGIKMVSKDNLRALLDAGVWTPKNEKFVLKIRDLIVRKALEEGKDVIVDDTGFAPAHEETLRAIAAEYKAEFAIKFFDVPVDECIRRDALRGPKMVGEKVIRGMYDRYLKPKPPEVPYVEGVPSAYIVDIDGTLAHMEGRRGPFEWHKVGGDAVDPVLPSILWKISVGVCIIIMSGRDSVCRPETEAWLSAHGIRHDLLVMRKAGDMRKDAIVKEELYNEHVRGKYNVLAVFDDRDQVVDMWRNKLGLRCYQVAEGKF